MSTKKIILNLSAILVVSAIALSCSKKEEETAPSKKSYNPISSFISGLPNMETYVDDGSWEFGVKIKFKKAGKVTHLGVRMPDDEVYPVTLWNMKDTSIIRTDHITADSGKTRYVAIPPVSVKAGDSLAVTVFSGDYYYYQKADYSDIYPADLGNFVITGYGYKESVYHSGTKADFPDEFQPDYYAGEAFIKFE